MGRMPAVPTATFGQNRTFETGLCDNRDIRANFVLAVHECARRRPSDRDTVSDMSEPAPDPGWHNPAGGESAAGTRRADALARRDRILAAAATLIGDRRTTMAEIAAAAQVG